MDIRSEKIKHALEHLELALNKSRDGFVNCFVQWVQFTSAPRVFGCGTSCRHQVRSDSIIDDLCREWKLVLYSNIALFFVYFSCILQQTLHSIYYYSNFKNNLYQHLRSTAYTLFTSLSHDVSVQVWGYNSREDWPNWNYQGQYSFTCLCLHQLTTT